VAFVITGDVVDEHSGALSDASVTLACDRPAVTSTDAKGHYECAGLWQLGARLPTITVVKQGYQPWREDVSHDDLVARDDRLHFRTVLRSGNGVIGRVVATGTAVSNALIRVVPDDDTTRQRLHWTDGNGRFAIPMASGERALRLILNHGEHGHAERFVRADELGIIDLGDVPVVPRRTLEFQVVFQDGAAVTGALVTACSTAGHLLYSDDGARHHSARTGDDGMVHWYGMAAGKYEVLLPGIVPDRIREQAAREEGIRANLSDGDEHKSPENLIGTVEVGETGRRLVLRKHRVTLAITAAGGRRIHPARTIEIWHGPEWDFRKVGSERIRKMWNVTMESAGDRFVEPGSKWRVLVASTTDLGSVVFTAPADKNHTVLRIALGEHR